MDESFSKELGEIRSPDPAPSTSATKEIEDLMATSSQIPEDPAEEATTAAGQAQPAHLEEHSIESQDVEAAEDDALLAIDLRIRLLETVLAGSISSSDAFQNRISSTDRRKIGTRAETIVKKLNDVLQAKHNDVVRRFVQSYDLNEPLLRIPNPIHQQAQSILKKDQQLSTNEKLSLVFESETEMTSLEKDLREIDLLNGRGFLDAGKLADCEPLKDALQALMEEVQVRTEAVAALESRITSTMSQYDSYVSRTC
ncbi:hypothetical protein CROQUDRAFT_39500 [Cronartium quercuum f. sp. fusiforme G11]|uniref:Uncharacterized protein n=1 Tax=Cronartium quercuum f. sp. fusiforme G11 TaxID=708437 RepID=A0A9P6NPN5_9BASI|nr:hypothetical protein CROQUDRAFT_39500 [Cronartium quercuum f. sp. fusiforme G11]